MRGRAPALIDRAWLVIVRVGLGFDQLTRTGTSHAGAVVGFAWISQALAICSVSKPTQSLDPLLSLWYWRQCADFLIGTSIAITRAVTFDTLRVAIHSGIVNHIDSLKIEIYRTSPLEVREVLKIQSESNETWLTVTQPNCSQTKYFEPWKLHNLPTINSVE